MSADGWIQGLPAVEVVREHEERHGGWWVSRFTGAADTRKAPQIHRLFVNARGEIRRADQAGDDYGMTCSGFDVERRPCLPDGTPLALAERLALHGRQLDCLREEIDRQREIAGRALRVSREAFAERDALRERVAALEESARCPFCEGKGGVRGTDTRSNVEVDADCGACDGTGSARSAAWVYERAARDARKMAEAYEGFTKRAEARTARAEREKDALRAALREAPCAQTCSAWGDDVGAFPCDCWKARALTGGGQ